MEEIWKDIEGYKGKYKISNVGRVKSLERMSIDNRKVKERILKPGIDGSGYLIVALYKERGKKAYNIHRLVAQAFIPNPNNYPIINHKDENPLNNSVENLEWCSYKYNNNYGNHNKKLSEAHKGQIPWNKDKYHSEETKKKISEAHKGRKHSEEHIKKRVELIQKMVIGINKKTGEKLIFQSITQAGKELEISNGNISACCRGRCKSAGGYIWSYYEEV